MIGPNMSEELILELVPVLLYLQYLDAFICRTLKYVILIREGTGYV